MSRRNRSFTLLELLIVVTVIGILAGIAIIRYGPVVEKARQAEAYTVLLEIVAAEKRYYLDYNSYASDFAALDSFTAAPSSDNFTYGIDATASKEGATATTKTGGTSYYMCFANGKSDSGSINCP